MVHLNDEARIYLDNAATSFPKPECVYDEMDAFGRTSAGNPGRSGHWMAVGSEHAINEARQTINQFFGGEDPKRCVSTLNCTDSLNMAMKGVLNHGDHVVTSILEHNSVSRPLRKREIDKRISVTKVKADGNGFIDPDDVARAMNPNTRLVVLAHASNVLGTIQPIREIGRLVRERDVLFLVDAAQTAGIVPINIREDYIDLLAFPGHKSLFGPMGIGGLYVGTRAQLRAWREGGSGGNSASPTQPTEFPQFLEAGTPNVLGIVGLCQGIKWIMAQGIDSLRGHELDLVERIHNWARASEKWRVHGKFDRATHVGTISLSAHNLDPAEIGTILDQEYKIAIRPGLHCAPYAHQSLGTMPAGTLRVSVGPFNTRDEVDLLCKALDEIAVEMGRTCCVRE